MRGCLFGVEQPLEHGGSLPEEQEERLLAQRWPRFVVRFWGCARCSSLTAATSGGEQGAANPGTEDGGPR